MRAAVDGRGAAARGNCPLAASRLTHVNLASVYSSGESRTGAPYLVMDYLEGSSLEQILTKDGHLEPTRAINIFIEI